MISKCLLASSWSVKFAPGISMCSYIAFFIAMDISSAQIEQHKWILAYSNYFKYLKQASMLV